LSLLSSLRSFLPVAFVCGLFLPAGAMGNSVSPLDWEQLPSIPDAVGFAGSFTGVHNNTLLVGGGANFPTRPPWEGGEKIWHDRIFALQPGATTWRDAGRLPRASGYGLSLALPEGVLFIGGGDASANFADVFLARWTGELVEFETLPSLPTPLAMPAGALLGRTVFVAGGLDQPSATQAQSAFLALDLDRLDEGWRTLDSWPGPERFLATGGALDGSFFLLGGARLIPGSDGKPQREWLRDAYRYTPGSGWKRIADLTTPVVAAPGPAPALGPAHLLLLGGDNGALLQVPPQHHPGFPRIVRAYHTVTDSWANLGELPFSLVTTGSAEWNGRIIVPGGEMRPGVRSTEVWAGTPRRPTPSFGWLNYTTLALYLAAVAGLGLGFLRRQKTTADYFKGGGRIPWWAAGLSIFATMLSSITFMAVPAKAFSTDWTFAVGNLAALALAPIVIAFYLPYFRRLNVTSAYEFLEHRFNLATRLYASASFILFQAGRMAVVIYLPALALSAAVGIEIHLCVLFIGITCALYTAAGGIEAVVWTDAVQAVVLLGAAIFSLFLIMSHLEGTPAEWWNEAASLGKLHVVNWSWDLTTASIMVIVVGNLLSNLAPYTADQAVVQRYITTRDQRQAERAIWLNAWMTVPATILFFAIGTALFLFYRQHPQSLEPTLAIDSIFPLFISQYMPAGVAGIVIAGIFAAAQSTASSSVNSVVTALMTDWVRRFRPEIPDHTCLRLSQWLSVVLGIAGTGAALYLATADVRSLWDTYMSLLGLLGSGLAGLFALGIFSRRATGAGALSGALVSAVFLFWIQRHTPLHFLMYGAVGTTTCFVVGYATSLTLPVRPTPQC
jgi:SSS family transporter